MKVETTALSIKHIAQMYCVNGKYFADLYRNNPLIRTQGGASGGRNELARSCVQICVQSKRKSSYDLVRNCLISKEWSH